MILDPPEHEVPAFQHGVTEPVVSNVRNAPLAIALIPVGTDQDLAGGPSEPLKTPEPPGQRDQPFPPDEEVRRDGSLAPDEVVVVRLQP